jgi:(R,R)-butanediol dehydrogenase/meso-butanediol dehydrogenase/diacetyl reductase
VIRASLSHAMHDDYVPALQLLHERKVDIEPLITDRIPLERTVDQGFKPLVDHPDQHLKVLIDCRR